MDVTRFAYPHLAFNQMKFSWWENFVLCDLYVERWNSLWLYYFLF